MKLLASQLLCSIVLVLHMYYYMYVLTVLPICTANSINDNIFCYYDQRKFRLILLK